MKTERNKFEPKNDGTAISIVQLTILSQNQAKNFNDQPCFRMKR